MKMAKTLQQFINEATRYTRTGNPLSTVDGGKVNLPKLGNLPPGQSPFNYTPKAPKNGNAVPGKAAASGTRITNYTPPAVKSNTLAQSTVGKVKQLAGKVINPAVRAAEKVARPFAAAVKGRVFPTVQAAGKELIYHTSEIEGARQGQTPTQAKLRAVTGVAGDAAGMMRGAAMGASWGARMAPLPYKPAGAAVGALVGAGLGSKYGRQITTKAYDTGIQVKQKGIEGFNKAVVEPAKIEFDIAKNKVTNASKQAAGYVSSVATNVKKKAADISKQAADYISTTAPRY